MSGVAALSIPALTTPGADLDVQSRVPASMVALFLNSGQGEWLHHDPFGVPAGSVLVPARDDIWFSSSTTSLIGPRSLAAASDVLAKLIGVGGDDARSLNIKSWFDQIRGRLVDLFGIPGAEAVLSPSGAQAGRLAVSIAQALLHRPLTNIIAGVAESDRVSVVSSDACSNGCETKAIAIRDETGYPRDPGAINREAAARVALALAAGRDVLLHVLEASHTGLAGVTRETARALADGAPGRVEILVHACQFRGEPTRLRHDLEAGCMVAMTDSQFAGGPGFAGALLLPPAMIQRLSLVQHLRTVPGASSARFDWPEALRNSCAKGFETPVNLGLGLRWEAALATIEPYLALPEAFRKQILTWFAGAVHRRVAARRHLRQVAGEPSRSKTISPIETVGASVTLGGAARLHSDLASPQSPPGAPLRLARACHIGHPVQIGTRAALSICASMPTVLDIAERVTQGCKVETAVAPVANDLDILFEKWDWLAGLEEHRHGFGEFP